MKLFYNINVNNIYKILICLPDIESVLLEQHNEDESIKFLDEMKELLINEIQPINKGISFELISQEKQLNIFDQHTINTTNKIKNQSKK